MEQSISRPGAFWIAVCGIFQMVLGGSAHASVATDASGAMPCAGRVRRVVLVHGIYNSGRYMGNMKSLLAARGWQVYCVSIKPNDASVPFEVMARQLSAFVSANIPAGEKFDLVGFSMGGLVCRYYIQKMKGWKRVHKFVTLSAPNHGTVWAWISGRAGIKQMRPDSKMLKELNANASQLAPLDYTSIYTPLDLTIVPPSSSRMPVARNVVSWVPLHALMVWMPAPLREVERALAD